MRPARALAVPLTATLLLAAFSVLPSTRHHLSLVWAFWGAASVLLVWNAVLLVTAVRGGRTLVLDVVLRKQHYVQACAQLSIYVYWAGIGVRFTTPRI